MEDALTPPAPPPTPTRTEGKGRLVGKLRSTTSVSQGTWTRCTVIPRPGSLRPSEGWQRIGQDAPTSLIVPAFLGRGWATGDSARHLNPSSMKRSGSPKRLASREGRTDVPDSAGLHSCKKRRLSFTTSSEWVPKKGAWRHLRSRWNHGQYVLMTRPGLRGAMATRHKAARRGVRKKSNRWHPVISTQVVGTSEESPHQLKGYDIRHRPAAASLETYSKKAKGKSQCR